MRRRTSRVPPAGMAQPVARGTPAAALPAWISPQLTQLVDAAPDGDQWLHELKYDGYRMHARLDRGAVKLLTRTEGTSARRRRSQRTGTDSAPEQAGFEPSVPVESVRSI